jgi:hypothetical protein
MIGNVIISSSKPENDSSRAKFSICITIMVERKAVVAYRYKGSSTGNNCPWSHPPPCKT